MWSGCLRNSAARFSRNQICRFSRLPRSVSRSFHRAISSGKWKKKRGLYFATGTKEGWICDRRGKMRFFDSSGEIARSGLVPEFPIEISIQEEPEEERKPELKRRVRSHG